jgi:hypothetical protein
LWGGTVRSSDGRAIHYRVWLLGGRVVGAALFGAGVVLPVSAADVWYKVEATHFTVGGSIPARRWPRSVFVIGRPLPSTDVCVFPSPKSTLTAAQKAGLRPTASESSRGSD